MKFSCFVFLNYRKWFSRSLIETLRNNYYYSFGYLHYSFYFWNRLTSMWPQMNWKTALRFATKCRYCKKYSMNNVDLSFCKITALLPHTRYPNGSNLARLPKLLLKSSYIEIISLFLSSVKHSGWFLPLQNQSLCT